MTELGNQVPQKRFKEFQNTHAWKQCKLEDIAEFNPKSELPEVFEYVDLESVIGTKMIAHRKETKATAPSRAQRRACLGDLFYQTVRPYQKNNYLFEKTYDNYVFSTGYAQMRPYGHGYFLLSLVQNDLFVKNVLDRCTGTGYPAINSNDLANMKVHIPTEDQEQVKVGEFFRKLDNLITLQQRKLEKTEALKSAYLVELFPTEGESKPKRRFAGFNQHWKVSSFFENIKSTIDFRGRTPRKLGLNWSETGYLALSALNVKHGYIDFNSDGHYGNQELYDKWMTGHELRKGQVLFTTEAPMGNVAQVPDNRGYILSQRTISFDVNPEKITNNFLAALLRSPKVFAELSALSSGGTAKGVSQKSLSHLKVTIPTNLEEQIKIGTFLKNIDDLINLHKRRLEKLQNLKKAYLNEMFV